uniref:Histidine kinase n=1 Tax=Tetraselmis sp. GSL018 TaxID=582737 RepID=A0A061QUV0_9CHLO
MSALGKTPHCTKNMLVLPSLPVYSTCKKSSALPRKFPLATSTVPRKSFVRLSQPPLPGPNSAPRRLNQVNAAPKDSLRIGFGVSDELDNNSAVLSAVKMANIDSPQLAFLACTVERDAADVIDHLKNTLPGVLVHGATSCGGVLSVGGGVKANGVSCLLVSGAPQGSLAAASSPITGECSAQAAAEKAALELQSQLNGSPKAVLMSTVPGMEEGVIQGIQKVFSAGVPIYGGTAADNEIAGKWSVLATEGALGSGVSLVGIGEGVSVGGALTSPYKPTGRSATATAALGRRVMELDGRPAADVVYEWLGDSIKEAYEEGGMILAQTSTKPILVTAPGATDGVAAHLAAVVRGGDGDGSCDFFVEVPEGSKVSMMDAGDGPSSGYSAAVAEAFDAARRSAGTDEPKAGLLFYCGGMGIAVGDNLQGALTSEEVTSKAAGVPVMGMTVFGEQSNTEPLGNKHCNLSVGMVLLG